MFAHNNQVIHARKIPIVLTWRETTVCEHKHSDARYVKRDVQTQTPIFLSKKSPHLNHIAFQYSELNPAAVPLPLAAKQQFRLCLLNRKQIYRYSVAQLERVNATNRRRTTTKYVNCELNLFAINRKRFNHISKSLSVVVPLAIVDEGNIQYGCTCAEMRTITMLCTLLRSIQVCRQ